MVCGYPPKRNEKKMTKEEILAMEPGRELDALVGKTFGFKPEIEWRAMDKEGKGYYICFDRKFEADEWDKKTKAKYPNHPYSDGGKIVEIEIYHKYSTDISSAWTVPAVG